MDRQRLLFTIWNWLPAFQAVAETEHLPTASERLRLTASALSRTITTLEDRVGRQLFARKGRALVLNAHGRRLLAGMTGAYAALNASLAALSSGELEGPIYACACGPLAQVLVVPALRDLQQQSAKLVPYVYGYDADEAIALVRAAQLDVVFSSARADASDLSTRFLGETSSGIYCGREHPLFSMRDIRSDDVLGHPFVATCSPGDGKPNDSFLPDVERQVDLYVHHGHVMLELCLAGHLLAVLPDFIAEPHVREGAMRRLPFAALPSTPLFAISAGAEVQHERVRLVIEQVGRRFAEVVAEAHQPATTTNAAIPDASPPPRDDGWLATGHDLLLRGEYAAAQRAYDSGYRARRKSGSGNPTDQARHALATASVLARRGRYREVESVCESAIEHADAPIAAALEATVSLTRCYRGDFVLARESLERARGHAVAALARSGSPSTDGARAWALVQRAEGNLLLATDHVREAIVAYEKGASMCEESGDAWEHSIALFNLGDAYALAGDIERASRLLDEAFRRKQAIGDRWGQAHVHYARARMALGRRDLATALAELAAGIQLAIALADPKLTAALNNAVGRARSSLGEDEEGQRAFRFALRDAVRCDARVEVVHALLGLCTLQLRGGKVAAAKGYAEKARSLAQELGARPELASALYALGEVASAEDRAGDAASLYRAAFDERSLTERPTRPD